MRRRLYGTRFTTGCGHSWLRRHSKWRICNLGGATIDCRACGELLIIPREQFKDHRSNRVPFVVHMPTFRKYLNEQDSRWPADGAGTGYVDFPLNRD